MKKKLFIFIWILLIYGLVGCQSQNEKSFIELDKPQILEEHILTLPTGATSLNVAKVYEVDGKPFLFLRMYPFNTLYIYDLVIDSLVKEIKISDISLIDIEYINNDNILLFGFSPKGNDSTLRVMNYDGNTQKVYPLIHANIASTQFPNKILRPLKKDMYPSTVVRVSDKIFISFRYPHYGIKGYSTKYPIIGYYDVKKDSLIMNQKIWYPELNDNIYYKSEMYDAYLSLNHKGNIIISFPYTPTFYEWDYNTDKLDTHNVNSQFMEPIPYSDTLFKNEREYYNWVFYNGLYSNMQSINISDSPKVYYRDILLSSIKHGEFKYLRAFYDENYTYLGESLIDIKEIHAQNYKGKHVVTTVENGKIVVRFTKQKFKPFNKKELKRKLEAIAHKKIENERKEKKELCSIVGESTIKFEYQRDDIVKYLGKAHAIKDTSYAVLIVNKMGCGSCNDYILRFMKNNQGVLYNIKDRPFYMIYVDENSTSQDVFQYLSTYMIFDKNHTKADISKLYSKFHPFAMYNPRLVLVSNKKVFYDEVHLPDEMEQCARKIFDYYGIEFDKK